MEDKEKYIEAAQSKCAGDSDVEVDDDAEISTGEDGVWVQAWVFVQK